MATHNRSADFSTLTPNLTYANVGEAMAWLNRVFGFRPHLRYVDGSGLVSHGQMRVGAALFMLSYRSDQPPSGAPRQSVVVLVDDVDTVFARAARAGAAVVAEPQDKVFGERQCALRDPEGHHWWFTQHVEDVDPHSWGARLVNEDEP